MKTSKLLSLIVAGSAVTAVHAEPSHPQLAPSALNAELKQFFANPKKSMNSRVVKYDSKGNPLPAKSRFFSDEDIASQAFVQKKDQVRTQNILPEAPDGEGRAGFRQNDRVEQLVDVGMGALRTLEEMEERNLTSARLSVHPWSDDYWALLHGTAASRYADDEFPRYTDNWQTKYDYANTAPNRAEDILASGDPVAINTLSPAEKFDALIGGSELTKNSWDQGRQYWESYGKVETWMGICHGWAPAAFELPRPQSLITLKSQAGQCIDFYPSDIKALGSLLYANVRFPTKFIGGRCNDKIDRSNPEQVDQETGRIISQNCFDNNPAAWHMATVSQLGLAKRSFILDITFDYEVWNQPVLSYEYVYWNPKTREHASSIQEAKVAIEDLTDDTFAKYRDSRTKYVVGIAMSVDYVVETSPTHRRSDSSQYDGVHSVTYKYDLELDANGKIIGGEWYSNDHPDFLWVPAKGTVVDSYADSYARGSWETGNSCETAQPVPAGWTAAAQRAAQYGQPLGKMVRKIFDLSAN